MLARAAPLISSAATHRSSFASLRLLSTLRAMEATTSVFGVMPDGRRVDAITLKNACGLSATVVTYGGTLTSVLVPSKAGGPAEEVTLSHRSLDALRTASPYFGCVVGRVANRIAGGKFSVDGTPYTLVTNNGPNCLHGGTVGFDKVLWSPTLVVTPEAAAVRLTYTSPDGEQGFPGTLHATATYALTAGNELRMEFEATVEGKATPINMCNHAYWNLSGGLRSPTVADHVVTLHTPFYTPVDSTQIPTGEIAAVKGTAFDLTTPTRLGDRLAGIDGGGKPGYDHNFARSADAKSAELPLAPIAEVSEPSSGRRMVVSTTAPGVQLYTGNWLDAATNGGGAHAALCLETQNYPDAINKPNFPSAILRPGERYRHVAVHAFSW